MTQAGPIRTKEINVRVFFFCLFVFLSYLGSSLSLAWELGWYEPLWGWGWSRRGAESWSPDLSPESRQVWRLICAWALQLRASPKSPSLLKPPWVGVLLHQLNRVSVTHITRTLLQMLLPHFANNTGSQCQIITKNKNKDVLSSTLTWGQRYNTVRNFSEFRR